MFFDQESYDDEVVKRVIMFDYRNPNLQKYRFANWDVVRGGKDVLEGTIAFAEGIDPAEILVNPQGLYLHGKTGSGKTHLAASALRYIDTYYGLSSFYQNMPDFWYMVKQSFNGHYQLDDLMDKVKHPEVVLLDDFDKGLTADYQVDLLYLIFEHRFSQGLISLFTANLPLESVSEKLSTVNQTYGDALNSRIVGCVTAVGKTIDRDNRGVRDG